MIYVILKAVSLILVIILGYVLKKGKLFGEKDYQVMVKVVINMTLPAAVIVSFSTTEFSASLILLALLGFGINCLMLLTGLLFSRGKPIAQRILYTFSLPGYNIGAFAMPFTQDFWGPAGAAVTCLFDVGNAIMCTGGSYAVADLMLHPGERRHAGLGSVLQKLCSSTPFVTYLSMLVLTLLGLKLPKPVVSLITPAANANPYCAMLMIGMMFEFHFPKQTVLAVARTVAVRNMVAIGLAGIFLLSPLPPLVKGTLAALVFAPPSVLTPAFVEKCGGDPAAASCATSLCTITAVIGIVTVLLLQA